MAGREAIAGDAVGEVVVEVAEEVVGEVAEEVAGEVAKAVVADVVEEVVGGKAITGREVVVNCLAAAGLFAIMAGPAAGRAAKYNIPTTPASSIPGTANRQNPNGPRRRRRSATDFSMFAHTDSEGMNCNPSIFCRTPFSNLGSYIGRFIFVGG